MASKSLLPWNATKLERGIEEAFRERLDVIPHLIRTTDNADMIPVKFLPWLAWAWRVEVWDTNWSEQQKRAAIKSSFVVHRRKGTIGAVKRALASIGVNIEMIEWFQDTPLAKPYTFRTRIDPGDNPLNASFWATLISIIERTKNVRSHLGVSDVLKHSNCQTYSAGVATYGIHISIKAAPETITNNSYHGGALAYGNIIQIGA